MSWRAQQHRHITLEQILGNQARGSLSSVVRRRFFGGRRSLVKGKESRGHKSFVKSISLDFPTDLTKTHLVQATIVLQPPMLKQFLRARPHRRIHKHSSWNATNGPGKRSGIGGHASSTIWNVTARIIFRISELRNKHQIPANSPVRAFPIFPYGGHLVSSSINMPATSLISRSIARRLNETPKSDSFVVRTLAALRSQCTSIGNRAPRGS
jgi:hypothetical protein